MMIQLTEGTKVQVLVASNPPNSGLPPSMLMVSAILSSQRDTITLTREEEIGNKNMEKKNTIKKNYPWLTIVQQVDLIFANKFHMQKKLLKDQKKREKSCKCSNKSSTQL